MPPVHVSHFVLCFGRFHGVLFLTSKICYRKENTFSINGQAAEKVLYHVTFSLADKSTVDATDLYKIVGSPNSHKGWLHSLIASFHKSNCGRREGCWTWTQFSWVHHLQTL